MSNSLAKIDTIELAGQDLVSFYYGGKIIFACKFTSIPDLIVQGQVNQESNILFVRGNSGEINMDVKFVETIITPLYGTQTYTPLGTSGFDSDAVTTRAIEIYDYLVHYVFQACCGPLGGPSEGTVTSVGFNVDGAVTAFEVLGGPITSSGAFVLNFLGSDTQYVRGDGTLASFPVTGQGPITWLWDGDLIGAAGLVTSVDFTGSAVNDVSYASGVLTVNIIGGAGGDNIYNSNGTLTGNRVLTGDGFNLTFNDVNAYQNNLLYNTGSFGIALSGDSQDGDYIFDANGHVFNYHSASGIIGVNKMGLGLSPFLPTGYVSGASGFYAGDYTTDSESIILIDQQQLILLNKQKMMFNTPSIGDTAAVGMVATLIDEVTGEWDWAVGGGGGGAYIPLAGTAVGDGVTGNIVFEASGDGNIIFPIGVTDPRGIQWGTTSPDLVALVGLSDSNGGWIQVDSGIIGGGLATRKYPATGAKYVRLDSSNSAATILGRLWMDIGSAPALSYTDSTGTTVSGSFTFTAAAEPKISTLTKNYTFADAAFKINGTTPTTGWVLGQTSGGLDYIDPNTIAPNLNAVLNVGNTTFLPIQFISDIDDSFQGQIGGTADGLTLTTINQKFYYLDDTGTYDVYADFWRRLSDVALVDGDVLTYDSASNTWIGKPAGGGGSAAWGSIGAGTGVGSQTDLITYLDDNYYPLSSNPAGYLTSASLSGLVPYTGATTDVDLGTHILNAQSIHAKGTGGNGHLGLKHQSANATAAGGESVLFANSAGDMKWKNDGGFYNTFVTSGITADRTYTFKDASGTVAFTSDIPSITPAALTKTDDTNVTLSLGGTPATSLLQAVSLTLGWTGTLSIARGGTNSSTALANDKVMVSTSGAIVESSTTTTQLSYLDATSSIQTQLDALDSTNIETFLTTTLTGMTINSGVVRYYIIDGVLNSNTITGNTGICVKVPKGGTLQSYNLRTTTSQPATGAMSFTIQIGAAPSSLADTTMVITVAAGSAAGDFTTANTATLTDGYWICQKMANAAATASASITGTTVSLKR